MPLSAYSDLSEVSELSLTWSGTQAALKLTGGDAAFAYDAVLLFDRSQLKSREVRSGEFPDEYWERTTYHEALN